MSPLVSSHSTSILDGSGSAPEQSTKLSKKKRWGRRRVRKNAHPQKISKRELPAIGGKRFSDMSITQCFVFALGLLSGLRGVSAPVREKADVCSMTSLTTADLNSCPKAGLTDLITPDWAAKDRAPKLEETGRKEVVQTKFPADKCPADKCSALKEITYEKKSVRETDIQPESCKKPDLMEQIGPVKTMTGIYKKSDEASIVLGIHNREPVPVMKKFKDLGRLELKALQLAQIVEQINRYIHQNNLDFGLLSYNEEKGTYGKTYRTFPFSPCLQGLFSQLDSYDTALKEIFMFHKETGNYKAFSEDQKQLIKGRDALLTSIFESLKDKFNVIKKDTSGTLKINSDHEKERIQKHRQFLRSQFKRLDKVITQSEIKTMFRQCMKERQTCINENKRAHAAEVAERVRARREAFKNSIAVKAFNFVYVGCYALVGLCLSAFSLSLIPLPKKIKRYFSYRKKINIGRIIERRIKTQKTKMPVNLKESMGKCDKAQDEAFETKTKARYPTDWIQPHLPFYHDLTQVKKKKRPKKSRSIRAIARKLKDIIMPKKEELPARPWKEDIPINHQCIRPIYRKNYTPSSKDTDTKNIVAYAYFDPSSDAIKSTISDDAIKKMQSIHEAGRYAPHEQGATGYKCFKYQNEPIWEFKVAGDERLYGLTIPANEEGKQAGVAPLVIFDTLLNKKL
ncbi:hypothetical protein [Endozoicomonas sp. 4G]|uniref:hypothetical protein n=1 Tax=Endozoicomonas sp. 4G TaxID=2872754 RepID=UPI002078E4B4|nr:hypothetical protein [Endozoicomonas sp. 4G]